jgi:2-polyprenyl-6-methoxyphenol hydroxylase-like FAD-dependent oxidoreductase
MKPSIRSAILIGGGIGGLCSAIALRKIGVEAVVYERAASLAATGAGLTLWANAIDALRQIGLAEQVICAGSKIQNAAFRTAAGRKLMSSQHGELEARFGEPTIAIHRAELHSILLAALPAEAVVLNRACHSFEQHDQTVEARFDGGSSAAADLLIGADGIHSTIRQQLFPHIRLRYSGYTAWRGVVTTRDELALGSTSESWGPGMRFGIVPISAHQVYWFATANTPAGLAETAQERKRDLCERFAGWHDPIPALLEATPAGDILRNDIYDIRPFKPWSQGRAVLLGDAAHPTTPNMGQGACMAIESAVLLARLLDQERDIPAALRRYESERQPRTAWITNRSWETGRLGQLENPLACAVRNFVMSITPERVFISRIAQAAGYKV